MRRLISIFCAAVLGVGTLVAGGGPASAAEVVTVGPGESIQDAIDGVPPGSTVIVRRGVYRENLDIATDRLSLVGLGARLRPPTSPAPSICSDPEDPTATTGICIHDARGVNVTGFTVQEFGGTGIFVINALNTKITSNRAINNDEYGIFANSSTHTLIAYNRTAGSTEAGIYVGDSPTSRAKVIGNESVRNGLGVFIRNAQIGAVVNNLLHNNCVGALVLGDAPGPAGDFRMTGNVIARNRRFCPPAPEDEGAPALSGTGIVIASGRGMNINHNWIIENVPGGPVDFSGGVVVIQAGPTPPVDNSVRRNVIVANSIDIFSDGAGTGNVFIGNHCETSEPTGLCT